MDKLNKTQYGSEGSREPRWPSAVGSGVGKSWRWEERHGEREEVAELEEWIRESQWRFEEGRRSLGRSRWKEVEEEMDAEAGERVQSLLVQAVTRLQFLLLIDTPDSVTARFNSDGSGNIPAFMNKGDITCWRLLT